MVEIVRYSDWEERLSTYLARVEEDPFKWGTHDCALFAASCVFAMTGVDPAAAFRGKYDDAAGAALALREHGEGTLLRTVKSWFDTGIVPFAKRGDLVMRDINERDRALGVCVGQYSYFVGDDEYQGRIGLLPFPTNDCRYVFTVPFAPAVS